MKTNIKTSILIALMSLIARTSTYAYPPDNAAIPYYQAALKYQPEKAETFNENLIGYIKGNGQLTSEISSYVEKNHYLVKLLTDAAHLEFCDFGWDLSHSLINYSIEPLSQTRNFAMLLLADGKIAAGCANYSLAFERCLTVHRMARHFNQYFCICYLAGLRNITLADNVIQQMLPEVSGDQTVLSNLKNRLSELESFTIAPIIKSDEEIAITQMTKENIERFMREFGSSTEELIKNRIADADEQFYERNQQYWRDLLTQFMAALERPYPEAYKTLILLGEKPQKDAISNSDATLASIMLPPLGAAYNYDIQFKTFDNAIRTAVEIYLIKAKTGVLPTQLPTGLPGDLFGGGDFEYTKTADGFILRCKGKDLREDKILEYAFKVK